MGRRRPLSGGEERDSFEARLGRAVDYLEERLDGSRGTADAEGAAEAAGWSKWHFMRLFQAAFARAFSRAFGLAPSTYRKACLSGAPPRRPLAEPFEPRLPFEPPEPKARIEELPASGRTGRGDAAGMAPGNRPGGPLRDLRGPGPPARGDPGRDPGSVRQMVPIVGDGARRGLGRRGLLPPCPGRAPAVGGASAAAAYLSGLCLAKHSGHIPWENSAFERSSI
jgi:hypothetical protein